jgi:hypothetical protein
MGNTSRKHPYFLVKQPKKHPLEGKSLVAETEGGGGLASGHVSRELAGHRKGGSGEFLSEGILELYSEFEATFKLMSSEP